MKNNIHNSINSFVPLKFSKKKVKKMKNQPKTPDILKPQSTFSADLNVNNQHHPTPRVK